MDTVTVDTNETDIRPRGLKLLRAIDKFRDEKGMSPSVREMKDLLGLSSHSTVASHLAALLAQGYVAQPLGRVARGIVITEKGYRRLAGTE